ncbi:MAG: YIP1 family protein [Halanaerobiaceae bacterium]
MFLRIKSSILISIILILAISAIAIADTDANNFNIPYVSYTYDYWDEPMASPMPYVTDSVIDFSTYDIESLNDPNDLHVSGRNNIYIADTGNNRVVIFDKEWDLLRVIDEFENDQELDSFNNPMGLFVDQDENLYVADTDNKRIVVFDDQGEFDKAIGNPESEVEGVLPDDYGYKPSKVTVDRSGRMYVLSEDTYEGLLHFDRTGKFRGFMGAPTVRFNLWDQFWRLVATEQQLDRMQLRLPTEYSSIDIDDRGFIYSTVDGGLLVDREAVRRLNPSGEDVLRRNGFHNPIGDIDFPGEFDEADILGPSVFTDVVVEDYGVYSVLDRNRGRVFTYNNEGYLMYNFGFKGKDFGNSQTAIAIDKLDDNILILDRNNDWVTIYEPTEYALNMHSAIANHYDGHYDQATEMWEYVLKKNSNNDLAYTGIGLAHMRQDDFRKAMSYFEDGNNREYYSEAMALYRREVMNDYLPLFFLVIILGYFIFLIYSKWEGKNKYKKAFSELLASGEEKSWYFAKVKEVLSSVKYSLHVIFHPFDGFWDLKHEKRGNYPAAIIILILTGLTYVFVRQYTGFIFNPADLTSLNIFMEFAGIIAPFLLWCVVNWSLTTLVAGKGKFRDIFIASAYALTPIILVYIPLTIFSNFIIQSEGAFYYFFLSLAIFWTVFLLFFGIMVTHNFNVKKNLLMSVLTVAGIVFVVFISILFFNLAEQVYSFVREIYHEVIFRM